MLVGVLVVACATDDPPPPPKPTPPLPPAVSCVEGPGDLPRPPAGQLPCDLIPPAP